MLLLHGMPGIGKTTMIKVISQIAGFDPVILNGSDTRTGEEIIEKIKNVMENVSVNKLFVEKDEMKPRCLIIDEIDGAHFSSDSEKGI